MQIITTDSEAPPLQEQLKTKEVAGQTGESTSPKKYPGKKHVQEIKVSAEWSISFNNTVDNFIVGKTRLHVNNWYKLTSDK